MTDDKHFHAQLRDMPLHRLGQRGAQTVRGIPMANEKQIVLSMIVSGITS